MKTRLGPQRFDSTPERTDDQPPGRASPVSQGGFAESRPLSYTAISTYQACPLRYYFRYVARLPEEFISSSLVFGAAIHRAADVHYQTLLEGGESSLQKLTDAYTAAWADRDAEAAPIRFGRDDRKALDALARRMLLAFLASDLARPPGRIIAIEEELTGSLLTGVPDLFGRIDLLIDAGDELILTDLKTARSRWSPDHALDAATQLLLYHELVRPLADGRPIRLQFALITKTKTPEILTIPISAEARHIDRTKRLVDSLWHAISNRSFYPAPSPVQCPACPYRTACRQW